MSKYAVFFTLKGEAIARTMEQPSDRVLVVHRQGAGVPGGAGGAAVSGVASH